MENTNENKEVEKKSKVESLKKEFEEIQELFHGTNERTHECYGMYWLISEGLAELKGNAKNLGEIQEFLLETLYQGGSPNKYIQGFLLDKLYYLAEIVQKASVLIEEMWDENRELGWADTDQLLEEYEDYLMRRFGPNSDSE